MTCLHGPPDFGLGICSWHLQLGLGTECFDLLTLSFLTLALVSAVCILSSHLALDALTCLRCLFVLFNHWLCASMSRHGSPPCRCLGAVAARHGAATPGSRPPAVHKYVQVPCLAWDTTSGLISFAPLHVFVPRAFARNVRVRPVVSTLWCFVVTLRQYSQCTFGTSLYPFGCRGAADRIHACNALAQLFVSAWLSRAWCV